MFASAKASDMYTGKDTHMKKMPGNQSRTLSTLKILSMNSMDEPKSPTTIQAMHREDKLKELAKHPQLYHYVHGTPGDGFKNPDK
jgi:hypothetical protein